MQHLVHRRLSIRFRSSARRKIILDPAKQLDRWEKGRNIVVLVDDIAGAIKTSRTDYRGKVTTRANSRRLINHKTQQATRKEKPSCTRKCSRFIGIPCVLEQEHVFKRTSVLFQETQRTSRVEILESRVGILFSSQYSRCNAFYTATVFLKEPCT